MTLLKKLKLAEGVHMYYNESVATGPPEFMAVPTTIIDMELVDCVYTKKCESYSEAIVGSESIAPIVEE